MKDCNCILSNTINICDKISTTRHLQCLVINDICIYDYSIFDNVWSLTVTVQSRGEDSLVETEAGRGQSASTQTRDQATSLTYHIPLQGYTGTGSFKICLTSILISLSTFNVTKYP